MPEQLPRARVPVEETWELAHIFPSGRAWEVELAALEGAIDALAGQAGRLGQGAEALPAFLRDRDAVPPVTIGRWFALYALSPDRRIRREAYESLAAGLDRHKNTLATSLATHVRRNVTLARLRGYGSAVEMILDPQRVPEPVYRN